MFVICEVFVANQIYKIGYTLYTAKVFVANDGSATNDMVLQPMMVL